MHYSEEKSSCSTFRVITANFLGVRNFRIFTVRNIVLMTEEHVYPGCMFPKVLSLMLGRQVFPPSIHAPDLGFRKFSFQLNLNIQLVNAG